MRPSAALLLLLVLLASTGCGDDDPPAAPACSSSDRPVRPSALSSTPRVFHVPDPVRVGQVVEFLVPAGTASITIVEQAVSAPDLVTVRTSSSSGTSTFNLNNTAVPLIVRDPAGTLVYDDNQQVPDDISTLPVFFASDSPAVGTLTIPNTTAGLALLGPEGLPAGTWSLIVSDYAYECTSPAASPLPAGISCTSGASDRSTYDLTIITKPAEAGAVPAAGTLDVAIYFATTVADGPSGPEPLDAGLANAGGDEDLNRMAATLGGIFGAAGIAIGSVTYTLLPADVRAEYATGVDIDESGACSPLSQLLRLAAPGNTLNIFFVSSFQATGLSRDNQVVGIDGTIPGPSTIGETVASGAAVATHDLRFGRESCTGGLNLSCGADVTAYIIAHEAGHFLGLYHVTESQGTLFDPLADSGACPCSACKSTLAADRCLGATPAPVPGREHQMTVEECTQAGTSCGGGDNLMFWLLDQGSLGLLSDEQQAVMRANPLIQ